MFGDSCDLDILNLQNVGMMNSCRVLDNTVNGCRMVRFLSNTKTQMVDDAPRGFGKRISGRFPGEVSLLIFSVQGHGIVITLAH